MMAIIGYGDLTNEQHLLVSSALEDLAAKLGMTLYNWGGENTLSPGKVWDRHEAMMFLFEKRDV